jgi:hypothetical protein
VARRGGDDDDELCGMGWDKISFLSRFFSTPARPGTVSWPGPFNSATVYWLEGVQVSCCVGRAPGFGSWLRLRLFCYSQQCCCVVGTKIERERAMGGRTKGDSHLNIVEIYIAMSFVFLLFFILKLKVHFSNNSIVSRNWIYHLQSLYTWYNYMLTEKGIQLVS